MDRKILFTDLDGTLLNDKKEITPGNQEAIDEALAKGHYVVISTGRPLVSARIQAERLGLTKEGCYAITYPPENRLRERTAAHTRKAAFRCGRIV